MVIIILIIPILLNGCVGISSMAVDHSITSSYETTGPPDGIDQTTIDNSSNCTFHRLELDEVEIRKKGLLIKEYNITIPLAEQPFEESTLNICFGRSEALNSEVLKVCDKWLYEADEFEDRGNGNVELGGFVLEPGTFEITDGVLYMCADDYGDTNTTVVEDPNGGQQHEDWTIYLGQIGSAISIFALAAHLVSFCLVPSLRTLPGYNLAALSVAFLGGYSFSLIGQIPQVLGTECIVSGIIQQYFFLVAFFCMNSLAFDVWRTLSRATTKLCTSSHNAKRRQFIYYSIYSWGTPIIISVITVTLDNVKGVPQWIRPEFGHDDTCWMNNLTAKLVFFAGPAFSLFVLNVLFFVFSAFIIKNNTMKCTSEEQKQTAKYNFVLYLRLGLMMGVTWVIGVVATIAKSNVLWNIADMLNSLQGLFIFLLFSCSKKVFKTIREKSYLKTFKLSDILQTPKTSTTDVPNGKGLFPGDTRSPKTSTTDLPNLKELVPGAARSPKSSTTDIPNLMELASEDTRIRKIATIDITNITPNFK